ncbi:DUF3942 family protein [Bacillus pseudomycoides]|uniref:DUF3942 family protein n=1 Tax=Bacillus pseudomycoides TaxID=64104 RepID=UPI00211ECE82|nr:DUF3942 family protein [Bacillus pseudomycoides]
MDKLDQFIEKAQAYVVTDLEEKSLREKYKQVILPGMLRIKEGLKRVEGYDYDMSIGDTFTSLKLHNNSLSLKLESAENCILIIVNKDNNYAIVDRVILQEENLFSKKRGEIFTEDTLVEYLNETFEEIIG